MSRGNRKRRVDLGLLAAPVKCSARTTAGEPCKRSPIKGGNVCATHGGSAGHVVAAARRRLMASSDRVGALLLRIAEDEKTPPAVRLAAIRDVLDRAGVTVKQEVEVTVQPWQQLIEGIVSEVPDDGIRTFGSLQRDYVDGEVVDLVPPVDNEPGEDDDDLPALPAAPAPTPAAAPQRIPSRRRRGNRLAGH